jgi:hypothetical protein
MKNRQGLFNILLLIVTLTLIISCKISKKSQPDKNDFLNVEMRKMYSVNKGIYLFFEKGFINDKIKIESKDRILVDTIISTKKTSQLTIALVIADSIFNSSNQIKCYINEKMFRFRIKDNYKNIRISYDNKKKKLFLMYDNNINLYE